MSRPFFVLASALGFVGVAAGAFGAHMIRGTVDAPRLEIFETAVLYHLVHSLAMLVAAWALEKYEQRDFINAGWFFCAGVALFSGSLYILVLTDAAWLGMVTPVGGFSFLAGWFSLARGFWKLK